MPSPKGIIRNERSEIKATFPVKVFVVDREPLVRRGLFLWLSQHPQLVICGDTGDEFQARSEMQSIRPDLAIIDPSLESGDAVALIEWLRRELPSAKVLVHTMHDTIPHAMRLFRAGAHGFVPKGPGAEELLEAIDLLTSGRVYVPKEMASFFTHCLLEEGDSKLTESHNTAMMQLSGSGASLFPKCNTRKQGQTCEGCFETR